MIVRIKYNKAILKKYYDNELGVIINHFINHYIVLIRELHSGITVNKHDEVNDL